MNWGCRAAFMRFLVPAEAEYHGHTLEYVRGPAWSGWRCQWCGAPFKTSEEHQHAGFPPMEVIETEELPTDEREAAAVILATCASTPSEIYEAGNVFSSALDRSEDIAIAQYCMVRLGDFALMNEVRQEAEAGNWVSYFAMAESHLRTGLLWMPT